MRAYEVVRATGMPISEWQRQGRSRHRIVSPTILLMPPRAALYAACDARLLAMMAAGGLDEAKALAAQRSAPDLAGDEGVGIPELLRHLRGEIDARCGNSAGPARHPPLRQAADHLVSPPDRRRT